MPVFHWFNRFLKGEDPLIEMAARDFFPAEQLRVFDKLPKDEVNTTIDETFVPKAVTPEPAGSLAGYLAALRAKVFAGWPQECRPAKPVLIGHSTQGDVRLQTYSFNSQPDVTLQLLVLRDPKVKRPAGVLLTVLDAESWTNSPVRGLWLEGATAPMGLLREQMQAGKLALAFVAPRGVEPSKWSRNLKKWTQIRRRYMLLGQTLDSMRVWDIRCAARTIKALAEFKKTPLCLQAKGQMGVNAAYAALFEPEIQKLELEGVPASQAEGPDYLNVLRVWDLPQVWKGLGERVELRKP